MIIDTVIQYHKDRKTRAENECLLGTVAQEIIIIDKLEIIKGKQI